MKIAIHQPRISYYIGGGERVPLEQAKYLSKLGHLVTIVTIRPNKKSLLFKSFIKNNPLVKIEYFEPSNKLKQLYGIDLGQNRYRCDAESLEFGHLTEKYYQRNIFDLVAAHYTVDVLKIPRNQNTILHLHGCPAHKRNIDNRSLRRADNFISVAKYVRDFWREMHHIEKPIFLAYNGVNNNYFRPIKIIKNYDLLFIGRLIKIKGVDDLLNAISLIVKKKQNLKTVIIGNGPEKEKLKFLAKKLKINQNIIWLDSITDVKLLQLYNSSKVSVFPSIAKEGVLTTMLEAAACNSAIITANCCGMWEFLKNNQNGLLVEPRNPKLLASAIMRLLSNEDLVKKLGKNALIAVNKHWTWKKQARKLELIYKLCLKK